MDLWLRGGILTVKESSSNTPSMDELTEENTVAVQSVSSQHTKKQGEDDKISKRKCE